MNKKSAVPLLLSESASTGAAEQEIQKLSIIVSQIADTVVITNTAGIIEYVNPAFEKTTGYGRAEAIGQTPRILKSGQHDQKFYENLWQTVLRGGVFQDEIINRKKNGELFYEVKTITPIRNAEGAIIHFVATGKDITERKQAEQSLRESEARLSAISANLSSADLFVMVYGQDGHQYYEYVSSSLEQMMGVSVDDALRDIAKVREVILPEYRAKLLQAEKQSLENLTRLEMEIALRHKHTKKICWVLLRATPYRRADGSTFWYGVHIDITERRQAMLQQETAYNIAEAAQSAQSLQDLYPQIQLQIARVMYAENIYIALFEEETDLLHFVFSVDKVDPFRDSIHPGKGLTAHVLRTGKSLLYAPEKDTLGIEVFGVVPKAWLGAPLIVQGKTIGVIAVQHYTDPNAYTEREQQMLEYVSSQVATAIDRKQAEVSQRRQQRLLAYHYRLVEIMNSISTRFINLPTEQIDAQMEQALKELGEFEKVDRASVFMFDQAHGTMSNTLEWCASGVEAQIANLQNVPFALLPWWMEKMNHGETIYIPSVSQLPPDAKLEREILESQGIQALLAVPLVSNNALIGFAGFDVASQPRTWDADTILLIKMIGDIFSNALTRKQADQVLRSSEEKFSKAFQSSPDAMVISSIESGRMLEVNDGFLRSTGYSRDEVIGYTSLEKKLWSTDEDRKHLVQALASTGKIHDMEAKFRLKSGELRDGLISAQIIELEREQKCLLIVVRDITDQKLAHELLEKSQASLETAQEIAHLGSWEFDPNTGSGVSWSREMYRLFHRKIEQGALDWENFITLVHPDDRQALSDAQRCAEETGELVSLEYRAFPIPHELHYFKCSIQIVRDEQGQVMRTSGTVLDVTESRQMELAIKERIKELTCLFAVSRLLQDATASPDTLCQQIVKELIPAMPLPELIVPVIELNEERYSIDCENEGLLYGLSTEIEVDGKECGKLSIYYRKGESFTIPEEQELIDNIARMLGLWLERRQAEENAKYREKLLEKVIQLGKNITAITDLDQCLRQINQDTREGLGYDRTGLFLYDSAKRLVYGAYGTSRTGEIVDNTWYVKSVDEWPNWQTALQSQTGVLLERDYQSIYHPAPDDEMYGVREHISLAAWAGDKPVALITVDNLMSKRQIGPADLEALQLFAGYAGLAIENARLNTQLEKRVEQRTTEVRDLYDNAPTGYHSLDSEGKFMMVNQTELNWLGYAREEMIGQPFIDFLTPASHALFNATFSAFKKDGALKDVEFTLIRKDGSLLPALVNSTAIYDAQGNYVMSRSNMFDISEHKKADEALHESRDQLSAANAALEKASHLKDEFLASMSHELRTPLTSILGLSEALQLQTFGPLNERQLKSLKTVQTSGRHLLDLINDILDLSKIEAGKLDLQFEPCFVADVCQASLNLVKGMAHQKKQIVNFSMNPPSITIRADVRRLKQMLVNLLSNAVKFTSEGGLLGLEVQACEAERMVQFTVWDKGIGISLEEMDKLFRPFTQLDSRLARQYYGTGLGLSLVHRMAELHGGSIKVESVPGDGSRFSILLPWSPDVTQPMPDLIKPEAGTIKYVMVVEDNAVDAENAALYLQALDIKDIAQPTFRGALEKAAFLRPSVILLDVNLVDGSGLDLLAKLKADARTREIPVIIASVEERRSEAAKLGALGYLVKPYSQQDLGAELEKAATFSRPADSAMAIGSLAITPLVMIADDNEQILEMVSDFLEAQGYRVIATRSGFELLDHAPEYHPDLMLVDIQMPGMDGLETMRRLRAHTDSAVASTPIIAVTALAMPGDREKCLQAGANEYMSKPITLTKLLGQVKKFLKVDVQ